MQVDRSRFLFLTASLAAAACNQAQPAASPDTGGAQPARSGDARASGEPHTLGSADPSVWLEIEPGSGDQRLEPGDPGCDNQVGRPSGCSLSAPPGHCESFESTQRLCESYPEFMQPRAAEAAVDCMLAASGTDQICSGIWNQCTAAGIHASCIEPGTAAECETISSMCGGHLDHFTCQQTLSAVRPVHVASVSSCIREFCEVDFCVTDLARF